MTIKIETKSHETLTETVEGREIASLRLDRKKGMFLKNEIDLFCVELSPADVSRFAEMVTAGELRLSDWSEADDQDLDALECHEGLDEALDALGTE